ncbi:hypothetical protein [uncultured Brevundimonas sp.]|uniref:hypothetical protein n=1 Tax=uncultured Brevundimonas sp. TaxID=213418 RepID=UPI0025FF527A|nr:hypothetical protein [uncultured Brevundimonas sp.]
MLYGGEASQELWREARWAFIHGQYVAAIMLSQALAEQMLAAYLDVDTHADSLPSRVTFSETLKRCVKRGVLSEADANGLRELIAQRNPLSHFRSIDDPANLSRRVLDTLEPAEMHLRRVATSAIGTAARLLALPAFRLGS